MKAKTAEQKRKLVGKVFEAQRKKQKLSRYAISQRVKLTQTQIKSIDTGCKAYTADSLLLYASAIGITVQFCVE